jgi:C2 domain
MSLDPSESINNMGSLRVDVLDGSNLPSADRNGFSDPYCKFELNDQTVFKTQVQKKTLQPAWNECFDVDIASRTAAKFVCKVYDWDFASEPDFLGAATINLELLEPFKPQMYNLALDGKSGSVRIRLLFKPSYVTRSRHGSTTFSGTFAAPGKIVTGVAGVPIKGVGIAAHGVGKGASYIKHGFKTKKKDNDEVNGSISDIAQDDASAIIPDGPGSLLRPTPLISEENAAPVTPPGTAIEASHSRTKSFGANSSHSVSARAAPSTAMGMAHFTIVSTSGYPPSSSIIIYIKQLSNKKVIHKTKHIKSPTGIVQFDESFKHICSADTQFQIQVKAHATFGSDDDLGEGLFLVDESGTSQEKIIKAGSGSVIVKSNFVSSENGSTESPKNGHRRGFLSKSQNGRGSRESTPTPNS